jgi:hypothetical protein
LSPFPKQNRKQLHDHHRTLHTYCSPRSQHQDGICS